MPHELPRPGATRSPDRRSGRRRHRIALAATLTLGITASAAVTSTASAWAAPNQRPPAPAARMVVFACPDPAQAVRAAGGQVEAQLPLFGGVAASLPAGAHPSGCLTAADRSLHVTGLPAADPGADAPAVTARATLGLSAGSPSGSDVTVALVDTGVADSPDLAGRVTHVDVTGRGTGDGYGHGTFLAGLIAGNGRASGGAYTGAAPNARILDVRVADADGSTSLIRVLRGLQVVAARQHELGVRVLNLSLSSGSELPYQVDPLALALEALWNRGVVVLAAAGNDGPKPGSIASPGVDPTLLTVGALDEAGTASRDDDTVADFSSRGPAAQGVAKPDLVAPGVHLVSLRAPGSTVDTENPGSRVGDQYFRGSGTSMSTALASGVVADVLSARRNLDPDAVKRLLTASAYRAPGLTDRSAAGSGGLDAAAAFVDDLPPADAPDGWALAPADVWDQLSQALLSGDRKGAFAAWQRLSPQARSWVARSWLALSPAARSWLAAAWAGHTWQGSDGDADAWQARSWIALGWTARSWLARSWLARSWLDSDWAARSWLARSWLSDGWLARSWLARSWLARSWLDSDWATSAWTADAWTVRDWS